MSQGNQGSKAQKQDGDDTAECTGQNLDWDKYESCPVEFYQIKKDEPLCMIHASDIGRDENGNQCVPTQYTFDETSQQSSEPELYRRGGPVMRITFPDFKYNFLKSRHEEFSRLHGMYLRRLGFKISAVFPDGKKLPKVPLVFEGWTEDVMVSDREICWFCRDDHPDLPDVIEAGLPFVHAGHTKADANAGVLVFDRDPKLAHDPAVPQKVVRRKVMFGDGGVRDAAVCAADCEVCKR